MKLNKIFSSNMVFAANLPIRIYGEGRGMAEISFADYSETVNSKSESWMVEFPPLNYGGPYTLKAVFEDNVVVLDNIYVGKVLLCAGQSNIEFKLKEANKPEEGVSSDERLRMFVTSRMEDNERFTPKDGWVVAADDNIMDWSALGFFAASEIACCADTNAQKARCLWEWNRDFLARKKPARRGRPIPNDWDRPIVRVPLSNQNG